MKYGPKVLFVIQPHSYEVSISKHVKLYLPKVLELKNKFFVYLEVEEQTIKCMVVWVTKDNAHTGGFLTARTTLVL